MSQPASAVPASTTESPTKPSLEQMRALIEDTRLRYPGQCRDFPAADDGPGLDQMAQVWIDTLDGQVDWLAKDEQGRTLLRRCLQEHARGPNAQFPSTPAHLNVAVDRLQEARAKQGLADRQTQWRHERRTTAQAVATEKAQPGDNKDRLMALAHISYVQGRPVDPDNPYWPSTPGEAALLRATIHNDREPELPDAWKLIGQAWKRAAGLGVPPLEEFVVRRWVRNYGEEFVLGHLQDAAEGARQAMRESVQAYHRILRSAFFARYPDKARDPWAYR